jgi:hypothetical protein
MAIGDKKSIPNNGHITAEAFSSHLYIDEYPGAWGTIDTRTQCSLWKRASSGLHNVRILTIQLVTRNSEGIQPNVSLGMIVAQVLAVPGYIGVELSEKVTKDAPDTG